MKKLDFLLQTDDMRCKSKWKHLNVDPNIAYDSHTKTEKETWKCVHLEWKSRSFPYQKMPSIVVCCFRGFLFWKEKQQIYDELPYRPLLLQFDPLNEKETSDCINKQPMIVVSIEKHLFSSPQTLMWGIIKMDPRTLVSDVSKRLKIVNRSFVLSTISSHRNRCFPTHHINSNVKHHKLCWILFFFAASSPSRSQERKNTLKMFSVSTEDAKKEIRSFVLLFICVKTIPNKHSNDHS